MSTPESNVFPVDISDSTEASGDALTSALGSVVNPPTTAEAQSYARKILQKSLSGGPEEGEASLFKDLHTNAENARQALQEARARLMQQQITPREQQMARLAAAFAPTKTGVFGEGLGNQFSTEHDLLAQQRQFEGQKSQQDLGLATQLQGIDANTLDARMKLQQMHEAQQNTLAGKALTVLGRSISPNKILGATSPIGKMVEDRYGVGSLQTDQGKKAFDAYAAQQEADKHRGDFTPQHGDLLAAMAVAGVSLPAGLRSKQQQAATLQGLIDSNPGSSPTDIAELVRTGQLDFNGSKRSTGQLAGVLAAANAQSSKLEKDFAQMEPLIAQLPDAPNVVNRIFVGLKNDLSFGGDKDSAKLVLYMREAATEYAKLVSGSTGAAAPAEGNIKEAVDIFHKAFTENGYQGLKEAMLQSAQNKRDAYSEGLHTAAQRGLVSGITSSKTPTNIQLPPEAVKKLQEGYTTTFGNGQKWTLYNGQPTQVK